MSLLLASWRANPRVFAATTTRRGGVSQPPYSELNLSEHVGDEAGAVATNRMCLTALTGQQPETFCWMSQVHGNRVVQAGAETLPEADACWTREIGRVCVVQTADCLPVLFSDRAGTWVAAAHAGWRGLLAGVLEETIKTAPAGSELLAWLGPAIGPKAFEVGPEVKAAFLAENRAYISAFVRSQRESYWLMNIYTIARMKLLSAGVSGVHGGEHCTASDARRFYSYRRDGNTGRMATMIWLKS